MAPGQSGRQRPWAKIGMQPRRCVALRNARRGLQPFWAMPEAGGMADMEEQTKERRGPKKKSPYSGLMRVNPLGLEPRTPTLKVLCSSQLS